MILRKATHALMLYLWGWEELDEHLGKSENIRKTRRTYVSGDFILEVWEFGGWRSPKSRLLARRLWFGSQRGSLKANTNYLSLELVRLSEPETR